LSKTDLTFKLISEAKKNYDKKEITEIHEGLLFSETGFVFPVIDGIPRMLLEAIYDYKDFMQKHLPDYYDIKKKLEEKFPGLIHYCRKKNEKTKKSFEFEWSFLDAVKKDKIWEADVDELGKIFLNETGQSSAYFEDKTIIDVGCGHGIMTARIAKISKLAIGVEISKAVENAYLKNTNSSAWYVQGDLQFLSFSASTFDVVYSSGVIHHTNNTELSLSLIETMLKKNGLICLWLYHPQKNSIHNFMLFIRSIISKMPLKLTFWLLAIFIFPFTFLFKKIKNRKAINYREEMIYLLDFFTPEFRFEITHDLATAWLQQREYQNIQVTTSDQFGFSISAKK